MFPHRSNTSGFAFFVGGSVLAHSSNAWASQGNWDFIWWILGIGGVVLLGLFGLLIRAIYKGLKGERKPLSQRDKVIHGVSLAVFGFVGLGLCWRFFVGHGPDNSWNLLFAFPCLGLATYHIWMFMRKVSEPT